MTTATAVLNPARYYISRRQTGPPVGGGGGGGGVASGRNGRSGSRTITTPTTTSTATRVAHRQKNSRRPFAIAAVAEGQGKKMSATPVPEDPDIGEVLYSAEVLDARIKEMAADLVRDYADKKPVFLPVMTGAFIFSADLLRAIRPPIKGMWIESIKAKSYFGTETSGEVKVNEITIDLKDRHVVLVEDIVDTGLTLEALKGRVMAAGAASVALVSLLNKKSRRRNGMQPDYAGFVCEDKFVVGYGLDFDSEYRELPYIGVLKPEVGWCTLNSF